MEKLEQTVKELMQNEDRKDAEFRYLIVSTEIGDLGKYITHDQKLNPGARPHGNKEDETLAYGQAFVQLTALAQLRDINVNDAVSKGLENWIDTDWRKVEAQNQGEIRGKTVFYGSVVGEAYVANTQKELGEIPAGSVLITSFAKPDLVNYLDDVLAIVTDHGGVTCHLANVAREKGKICIVGTGNATSLIKTGDLISVEANEKEGRIYRS